MLKIYQEKPYAPHKICRKDIFQNPTFIPDKRSQHTRTWSDLLLYDHKKKKKNLWVKIRQNDKWLNVFLLKSQYEKGACSHHIYSSMYWNFSQCSKARKRKQASDLKEKHQNVSRYLYHYLCRQSNGKYKKSTRTSNYIWWCCII